MTMVLSLLADGGAAIEEQCQNLVTAWNLKNKQGITGVEGMSFMCYVQSREESSSTAR